MQRDGFAASPGRWLNNASKLKGDGVIDVDETRTHGTIEPYTENRILTLLSTFWFSTFFVGLSWPNPVTRLYFPWHAIPSLSNPSLSSQLFSRSVANDTT